MRKYAATGLLVLKWNAVMNQFSVCATSQNLRTNSAPICHETAWKCMNLHIGKVLKYEYYG